MQTYRIPGDRLAMSSTRRFRYLRSFLSASLLVLAAFLLSLPAALAQAVSGTIVGTVTDPTGAAVANAQVTIVLTGQGTTYTAVTNESGNFTEPDLPPGIYTVTITAPGFKKDVRENITLETNTTTRVDVTLPPGSTSEQITVTTAPPQLQTDRADISTTIEQRRSPTSR